MSGWSEVAPDIVLSSLYTVLLILLATDRKGNFNTPFYRFFIATGMHLSVSVSLPSPKMTTSANRKSMGKRVGHANRIKYA